MASNLDEQADRIERERAFHDERFADDSARAAAGRFYDLAAGAAASYAAALAEVPSGSRALEYGAGIGGDGFDLARRGVSVTGIDISPVAVDMANKAVMEQGIDPLACRYREMDAEHLDLPDRSFDLVFGSGILHHLNLEASFAEIARVLAPGGKAVFFEPMGHNPAINLYRRMTPSMRSPDEHPLLKTDIESARRWFEAVDADFNVLTTFAAVPFHRFSWYRSLIAWLNRTDAVTFRRIPALRRFGWIVVLQLSQPQDPDSGPADRA